MEQPITRPGVALVTGAGGGIGAAVARRLGADGYHVCVNDVDAGRAEAIAKGIRTAGGSADIGIADVSDSRAVDAMIDLLEAEVGPIQVLVNNAGIGGNAAIRDVTDEYWDRVRSIDLDGVLY